MLIDDVKNEILINELQLGNELNSCIHEKERSQFSLLLAMLTEDVIAHSQFFLPKTEEAQVTKDEAALRHYFKLPEKQQLSLTDIDNISLYNQAELIQGKTLAPLNLSDVLNPVPLAFRNDKTHIPKDIISNTTLYCQKKYECREKKFRPSRLNFKAEEWLNTVNETMKNHIEISV